MANPAAARIGRLRRILGLGFGLAVSVGGTLGIGILGAPGAIAGQLHTARAILPIPELAASTLPAAAAAERIAGPRGGLIITALSLISLPPILNAILMVGTRILFALGRDRLVWSRTAEVNRRGTPGVATLVTTVVALRRRRSRLDNV